MVNISEEQFKKFSKIKSLFLLKTRVPKENSWYSWSDNRIWLQIVTQVLVVQSSTAAEKLEKNPALKKQISYYALLQIEKKEELLKQINHVLKSVGTRMQNRKTKALAHNFKVLKSFKGGPKALLKRLSEFKGPNGDKRKIKYVMKIMQYIKDKGARDFLMETGLVTNAIAFDVRIQNIFKKTGVMLPKGFQTKTKQYDEIEKEVLTKICKPLKISGVQFDRMLYQNYGKIKSSKL